MVPCLYIRQFARKLPFSNVPPWLVKYLTLMLENERTRIVGPVLSCEGDVHLQGWSVLIDLRALHLVLPHLQATCAVGMAWASAIDHEIALTTSILDANYTVAGMYPPSFTSFTNDQRKALLEGDQEIINRLHKCENVMRGDLFDAFDNLESLSDIMQYKFGGNIWRIGLLSQAFVNRVHTATALKLGIDSKPISCYRQQYTRRNRHLTLWGKLRRYVRRALAALL